MAWINAALLALAAFIVTAAGPALARDRDFGWGAPFNSHLDSYSGRPLGPPLPTLPPGYQYYNGRLVRVLYIAPGSVYVPDRHRRVYQTRPVHRHGASRQR